MNGKQSAIFGLTIIAGLINAASDIGKEKDPTPAIVGTFLVMVLLVALASIRSVSSVAVAFAIAFLITSAALNAKPILNAFTTLEGVKDNG